MRRTPLACDLCFNTGLSGHSGVVKQHASWMLTNARMPTGLIVRAAVRGSRKWAAHWGPPVSDAHQMSDWWRGIMVTCGCLSKSHSCRSKRFLDAGKGFGKRARCFCAYCLMIIDTCVWGFLQRGCTQCLSVSFPLHCGRAYISQSPPNVSSLL